MTSSVTGTKARESSSHATDGRFMFFKRRIYPIVLTIPAGHVELGRLLRGRRQGNVRRDRTGRRGASACR